MMSKISIISALLFTLALVMGIYLIVDVRVSGDEISTIRCGDGEVTLIDGSVYPMPEHLLDAFHCMSSVEFGDMLHRVGVVTYIDLCEFKMGMTGDVDGKGIGLCQMI